MAATDTEQEEDTEPLFKIQMSHWELMTEQLASQCQACQDANRNKEMITNNPWSYLSLGS